MNLRHCWGRKTVFLSVLYLARLHAATDLEREIVVQLSPFKVEGSLDEMLWNYARAGEIEVLTLCSERITAKICHAMTRSHHFVPDNAAASFGRPIQLVLFNQIEADGALPPATWKEMPENRLEYGWHRLANARLYPHEISAVNMFGIKTWSELNMRYAAYYLLNVRPSAPEWVREGLFGEQGALSSLFGRSSSTRFSRLGAFAWDYVDDINRSLKEDRLEHGLYPLVELFESPPPDDPELRWRWMLQAALFCRWQIYSSEGQRNGGRGFWNWVRMVRQGVVDEKAFEACVGFNYAQAQDRLLKYLHRVIGVPVDVPIRPYPLAEEISLRPATELEIARLLGEFQWQEAKRLREEGHWDQALKYETAARRTYQRGLGRTKGHAQLQAGLGLLEFEGGCHDEARVHLEKALEGKGADGRALLALARLRFAEIAMAADAGGRLNAEQIGFVLTPLFAARAEVPVDVAVYRLIGEVWSRSAITAEEKHLNVLLEGVANYPHDLELALQVAEVHVRHGHREIARVVATRGETLAGRSRHRAKFEALLAGLERP